MIGIQDVKEDAEVKAIMYIAENQIEALGVYGTFRTPFKHRKQMGGGDPGSDGR